MSELKWNWVYYPYLDAPNKQEESALKAGYIKVVIKDEADKVIAELKQKINEAQTELELWRDGSIISEVHQKELDGKRHSDYKRCLAMAKWCQDKLDVTYGFRYKHFEKWKWRWLELAEKFRR